MDPQPRTVSPAQLELRLVAKQTTYCLDLGGEDPQQFRKRLEELQRRPPPTSAFREAAELPPSPTADLAVEIVNRGREEVEIWLGGDDTHLSLELSGPGAVNVAFSYPITAHIEVSSPVRLAAGAVHAEALRQLDYGLRGRGQRWYWTTPGD